MKNVVKNAALALSLALSFGVPATLAKGKASAARVAAIKKCNEDYAAAKKDAAGKKGKDRKAAMAAASSAKKQCIASAPKP
ncbi:MAG: hypothetical protein QOF61_2065 [Acidobacteriota bacterium]|jgi:hypothetical protein|nr:hypothetical protein [Acidobacteriota bacterium]